MGRWRISSSIGSRKMTNDFLFYSPIYFYLSFIKNRVIAWISDIGSTCPLIPRHLLLPAGHNTLIGPKLRIKIGRIFGRQMLILTLPLFPKISLPSLQYLG